MGASSGIGRATALAYAAEGADIVLIARGRKLLDDAAQQCLQAGASSATAVVADVLDETAIDAAVADALERFGRVDVVVHAAMVMAYGTIEQLELRVIDRLMDTATRGRVEWRELRFVLSYSGRRFVGDRHVAARIGGRPRDGCIM